MARLGGAPLLALLLALIHVGTSSAQSCSAANGPVTCWTCQSGADVNIVSQLPRLNRAGLSVSANLGSYALFSCPANATASTEMCKLNLDTSGLMAQMTSGSAAQDPTAITNYVEVRAAWRESEVK
jgi:hypothetical protein